MTSRAAWRLSTGSSWGCMVGVFVDWGGGMDVLFWIEVAVWTGEWLCGIVGGTAEVGRWGVRGAFVVGFVWLEGLGSRLH